MAREARSKGNADRSRNSSGQRRAASTVGDLLALFDAGAKEEAWLTVHTVARLLAGHRPNADDWIQEATVRTLDQGAAALRRADSSLSIRAWLTGVFGKLECEQRRTGAARGSYRLGAIVDADVHRPAGTSLPGTIDRQSDGLTPTQDQVPELRIEGVADGDGARRLGISRGAYRGRVGRAIGKLRKANARSAPTRRMWATQLLAEGVFPRNRMKPGEPRQLLPHFLRGDSLEAIAKKICTTRSSVKNRLKRWKSWWLKRGEKKNMRRSDT